MTSWLQIYTWLHNDSFFFIYEWQYHLIESSGIVCAFVPTWHHTQQAVNTTFTYYDLIKLLC